MRIGLLVLPTRVGHGRDNLEALLAAITAAAGTCDVLVVGEAFGQGFDAVTDRPEADLDVGWRRDGPELSRLRSRAREVGMGVCVGLLERHGDHLHSSALLVGADGGDLHLHRRVSPGWHAPDADPAVYVDAPPPMAFELAGRRVAIGLCGDLWQHPDAFAALDADVLLWPVHVEWTPGAWAGGERAAYARLAGSLAPDVLLVNCLTTSSDEAAGAHGGAVWFHRGAVCDELGMGTPGLLVVDLG